MPTYRYECQSCGVIHEVFQSIKEPRLRKCPDCGGKLERLIGGGAGVLLKGSGFYSTDNRSSSYSKAAKSENKDGAAKPESKPESKPAADAPKPASQDSGKKKGRKSS